MQDDTTLESQLARIREGTRERLPQLMEWIQRLVADLESSKVKDALDVGDLAPDFTLRRADSDEPVRLSGQLERGPAVLSFYRGRW